MCVVTVIFLVALPACCNRPQPSNACRVVSPPPGAGAQGPSARLLSSRCAQCTHGSPLHGVVKKFVLVAGGSRGVVAWASFLCVCAADGGLEGSRRTEQPGTPLAFVPHALSDSHRGPSNHSMLSVGLRISQALSWGALLHWPAGLGVCVTLQAFGLTGHNASCLGDRFRFQHPLRPSPVPCAHPCSK